jgi:hypothetical protein
VSEKGTENFSQSLLIFQTEQRMDMLAERAYFSGQNLLWGKITRMLNILLYDRPDDELSLDEIEGISI